MSDDYSNYFLNNRAEPTKQRPGDQPLPTAVMGASVQAVFRDRYMDALPKTLIEYSFDREQIGISRYGSALYPHNGRDAVQDAFEECFDMVMYLIQLQMEAVYTVDMLVDAAVDFMHTLWIMWKLESPPVEV